jgi:FOG: GGDEF domain
MRLATLFLRGWPTPCPKSKRPYDTAARLGGEEFALLLPGASEVRARAITQRILNTFRTTPFHSQDGTEFFVTFSAGIASIKGEAAYNMEKILTWPTKLCMKPKIRDVTKLSPPRFSAMKNSRKAWCTAMKSTSFLWQTYLKVLD